jgi:hypothetical protein
LAAVAATAFVWVMVAVAGMQEPTSTYAHDEGISHLASRATQDDIDTALQQAWIYIKTTQRDDGGIPWFSDESNMDVTSRTLMALVASGYPVEWMTSSTGHTMADFVRSNAITYTHSPSGTTSAYLFPSRAGIVLAAAAAANEDLTNFGGMNLVQQLQDVYHADTGAYSTKAVAGSTSGQASVINQFWAVMGLAAAGEQVPEQATTYLMQGQGEDGSWTNSLDTTAFVIVGALASGNVAPTDPAIQKGLDYLRNAQELNGGWRPAWDSAALNANTTGWVLQALLAAGYDTPSESWRLPSGDPITALVGVQQDDGRLGAGQYANAYSTIEGIFGLVEQPIWLLGQQARANRALTWLKEIRNDDGSWNGFSGPDVGATCDAVLAFGAAGYDTLNSVYAPQTLDYLETQAADYAQKGPDAAGKLALAVTAAGENPRNFGGVDILQVIGEAPIYNSGGYGVITNTWHQALPMLALAAAPITNTTNITDITDTIVPSSAISNLLSLQQEGGGWPYDTQWSAPTVDSTSLAMQALLAAGVPADHDAIQQAVAYLKDAQDDQGGWQNANSTAYAIQALTAAGEDITSMGWTRGGHDPLSALAAYQKIDGPFVYQWTQTQWSSPSDNASATAQTIPALFGRPLPITNTALHEFRSVNRGVDADRTVAAMPWGVWQSDSEEIGVTDAVVVVPVGHDINQNNQAELRWRPIRDILNDPGEETAWVTETLHRAPSGSYTTTLSVAPTAIYELEATYLDADEVQVAGSMAAEGSMRGFLSEEQTWVNPHLREPDVVQTTQTVEATGFSIMTSVPMDAVAEPTLLLHALAPASGNLPTNVIFERLAFHMGAAQGETYHSSLSFSTPVTVEVGYDDTTVVNESGLMLIQWDEEASQWRDATTTCDPASQSTLNQTANTLQVPVCEGGRFALVSGSTDAIASFEVVADDPLIATTQKTTTTIKAMLKDAEGVPLTGVDVNFSVSEGTATLSNRTPSDQDGIATATLTAGTTEEIVTVLARTGEYSDTVDVQVYELAAGETPPTLNGAPIPFVQRSGGFVGTIDRGGLKGSTITIGETGDAPTQADIAAETAETTEITVGGGSILVLDAPTTSPISGTAWAGGFILQLTDSDGHIIPESTAIVSPAMSLSTSFADVDGYISQTAGLSYLDRTTSGSDGWREVSSTDMQNNQFSATITRNGQYGVFVSDSITLYLPLISQ